MIWNSLGNGRHRSTSAGEEVDRLLSIICPKSAEDSAESNDCLGVKDLFLNILPQAVYNKKVHAHLLDQGPVQHIKPECARKLVEGAVEYAQSLDLPPHADYRVGKLIFGDISAASCPQHFVSARRASPFSLPVRTTTLPVARKFCTRWSGSTARTDPLRHAYRGI